MTDETDDGWRERIVCNPKVLVGKPTVRGMRLSVEHILHALAAGVPEAELFSDYPGLETADLRACLAYAAELVERQCPVPAGA